MAELNTAAEWYFRRNKYESLMVKAAEFGEERDEDYSGEESGDEGSSSDGSASDYEEYRRKKKLRAKKKKQDHAKKINTKKENAEKPKMQYQGNEDEIASMIRKLNAMNLNDPEYAPIYYKVMVMDKSGTAEKCVKPPFTGGAMDRPRPRTNMSLTHNHHPVHDPDPSRAYEPVQYLSRNMLGGPPTSTIALKGNTPDEIIQAATTRQWEKYLSKVPYDVRPTFSAAPQSEYYGAEVLEDGQVLHKSAANNAFRAFYDEETGRCFAFACHEVTWSYQAAGDSRTAWPLELFYPSDTRLHDAMQKMLPPPEGASPEMMIFPKHATPYAPLLPSLEERLKALYANETGREGIDSLISNTVGQFGKPITPSTTDEDVPGTPLSARVAQDIEARVAAALEPNDEEGGLGQFTIIFHKPEDDDDVSSTSESSSEDDGGPFPRSCAYCNAPQHDTMLDCPMWGSEATSSAATPAHNDCDSPLNEEHPADDNVPEDLQRALDRLLGRTFDELLTYPLTAPIADISAFRDVVATATDVSAAFQKFKRVVERQREEQRGYEAEVQSMLTQRDEDDSDSDCGSMPELVSGSFSSRGRPDLRAWADRVETPVFDHQRGPVITRDLWSSSVASSTLGSSSESEGFFRIETIGVSPITTEWSVTTSELGIDPQLIIDTACRSALNQLPRDDALSDHATIASNEPLSPLSDIPTTAFLDSPHTSSRSAPIGTDQTRELGQWLRAGLDAQQQQLSWEDELGGAPLLSALRALHGPLRAHLDFVAMAAVERQRGELLAALEMGLVPVIPPPSPSPDLSQYPTSLDFSLPSVNEELTSTQAPEAGEPSPHGKDDKERGTGKEGEKGRSQFPAEAVEAVVYADLNLFKGARLAILESKRRLEYAVWRRYMPSEANFPAYYTSHPFLTDFETAQLHVLRDVLYLHERYTLVGLIDDILAIRLRNHYAIAQHVNAGSLDAHNPFTQYWELLPFPDSAIYPEHFSTDQGGYQSRDSQDLDSDSSMDDSELQYPDTPSSSERPVYQWGEPGSTSRWGSPRSEGDADDYRREHASLEGGADWSSGSEYIAEWGRYGVVSEDSSRASSV
ncbi:hypothetical protein B0H15DRAFT_944053 [Mycena belliarum]|uniref:Uncharacterized protein n=1 Tax=Mycena belliarum TaxID=1033014 RepID=A0AAD6UJ97_9AGAR|nr:hypothetical protein B0H15DRAFT_944053 [Mycena belliae]